MNDHLNRAQLLIGQRRWELAEKELRQALAAQPDDATPHALLALCLVERQQYADAQREAEVAIGAAPDLAFAHYVLARVLSERNDLSGALIAINEAIRIEPTDADYHAVQASLFFESRRWADALRAAESGLQFDPEHISANNLRAMALVKLGRQAEAGATINATLARNPDDAITHANQGWALLEQGDRKKALEHFREALRLDPTQEWARAGIVEALQAGNPIYAVMLRYFLWMQKLSSQAQWAVILGGYFGNRILGSLATNNPALRPWLLPIQLLYLVFVLLTWLAQPLFNLMLRFHPFGRYALSDEQVRAANWVGACLVSSVLVLLFGLATGFPPGSGTAAFVLFALSLPVSAIFKCAIGWPRRVMLAYSGVMALIGVSAVVLLARSSPEGSALRGLFAVGLFLGMFGANFLMAQRPAR